MSDPNGDGDRTHGTGAPPAVQEQERGHLNAGVVADESTPLRRDLGLPLLVLYGLGTTVGAGIYVLIGEVAGLAGAATPLAFVAAALLAGFSGGSFAELSSRFPRSAGEAVYVREGLGSRHLATAVGLLVVAAGSVSAATISNGFAGYVEELWGLPWAPALVGIVVLLTGAAIWGVVESVRLAAVITVVEIFGLGLVVWTTRGAWVGLPALLPQMLPGELVAWSGIGQAALIAFYAFLGFEDLANMAEETKNVRRVLPVAILLTLILTTLLYGVVATAAVLAIPAAELAASQAPLATLYARGGGDPRLLGGIAIFAVVNGAMIQIIMASRVLYGLSRQGALPQMLGRVHAARQTPTLATILIGAVVAMLGLGFPLVRLAEVTSIITLVVFLLVNLSLVRLHAKGPAPDGVIRVPRWVPVAGAVFTAGAVILRFVGIGG